MPAITEANHLVLTKQVIETGSRFAVHSAVMLIWLALTVLMCTARSAFTRAMFLTAFVALALFALFCEPATSVLYLLDTAEPAITTGGFNRA